MATKSPRSIDRVLDPIFTDDVARRVIDLELDVSLRERLDRLRERANEGILTEDERAEYREFVDSLDLLAILKVKARASLCRRAS